MFNTTYIAAGEQLRELVAACCSRYRVGLHQRSCSTPGPVTTNQIQIQICKQKSGHTGPERH